MRRFCLLLIAVSFVAFANSQTTTLISPTGDGGFENGASFAANGWTVVNGATNQWFVGSVATASAGTNSAYISDNATGTTHNYTLTSASTVHFYRDISFPAGQTNIVLSFKWKGQGESSYDYVTVYSMPTSVTPVFNSPAGGYQSWLNIPTAYSGATVHATPNNLNLQSAYQTQTICLPAAYAGTTRRLVFMWSNDGSGGTQPPGSIDEISLVASTPAAPSSSATSLLLSATASQITGSFTAAVGGADGYLVVRYPAGATPVAPTNGTTYTAGNALGTGVVVASTPLTSFTATGLTPSTNYDIYVYSYNSLTCSSGPFYKTTAPLTGTQATPACSSISGTISVGPTGTYTSLTQAFTSLASTGFTAAVVLELQAAYNSSVETFPLIVPEFPCGSNGLTIRPELGAAGLSITSSNATGTISFSSGDYVTVDGRPGGLGTIAQLAIGNTSTAGYTIQFINNASNNTIKYCNITGVNTSNSSGVIFFNNATGFTAGNSNNTISNCDIGAGATTPTNLIYCAGNTSDYGSMNNNVTVSNNNIHDWFNASSTTSSAAINIASGASDWTITGNSFYQIATRTFTMTTATDQGAIHIASATFGVNFTISNNFIGGTAPLCGGTPWTWTGGTTGTPTPRMIRITTSNGAFNNITGNTISNLAITTTSKIGRAHV